MDRSLSFLKNVLIVSVIIFFIQNLLWQIGYLAFGPKNNMNNFLYSLIFIFLYFFLAFYLLVFFYSILCIKIKINYKNRWFLAQGFSIVGYCIFRLGDIIDGDFINNFSLWEFVSFLIVGLILWPP